MNEKKSSDRNEMQKNRENIIRISKRLEKIFKNHVNKATKISRKKMQ